MEITKSAAGWLTKHRASSRMGCSAVTQHYTLLCLWLTLALFLNYLYPSLNLQGLENFCFRPISESSKLPSSKVCSKTKMASRSLCGFCGTAFWPYLKRCQKCRTVYYCDRDCQTQDWKYHKISCTIEVRKAVEVRIKDLSMTLPSSETPRPLRVSKIPDKVNVLY